MDRRRQVSSALFFIADLVEAADHYVTESAATFDVATPRRAGLLLHRRDPMARIDRRMREKIVPLARNVLRARRERKARSRYQTLSQVSAPPLKILSTRFRSR